MLNDVRLRQTREEGWDFPRTVGYILKKAVGFADDYAWKQQPY